MFLPAESTICHKSSNLLLICIIHEFEYLWNEKRCNKKASTIITVMKGLSNKLDLFFTSQELELTVVQKCDM